LSKFKFLINSSPCYFVTLLFLAKSTKSFIEDLTLKALTTFLNNFKNKITSLTPSEFRPLLLKFKVTFYALDLARVLESFLTPFSTTELLLKLISTYKLNKYITCDKTYKSLSDKASSNTDESATPQNPKSNCKFYNLFIDLNDLVK